jgi:hypothetical protein
MLGLFGFDVERRVCEIKHRDIRRIKRRARAAGVVGDGVIIGLVVSSRWIPRRKIGIEGDVDQITDRRRTAGNDRRAERIRVRILLSRDLGVDDTEFPGGGTSTSMPYSPPVTLALSKRVRVSTVTRPLMGPVMVGAPAKCWRTQSDADKSRRVSSVSKLKLRRPRLQTAPQNPDLARLRLPVHENK